MTPIKHPGDLCVVGQNWPVGMGLPVWPRAPRIGPPMGNIYRGDLVIILSCSSVGECDILCCSTSRVVIGFVNGYVFEHVLKKVEL